MKKLLTLCLIAGIGASVYAQDGQTAADKKFLAGLTVGGAINFNTPETVTIDSKAGGDFVVGTMLDWNFAKNIGITTGLEFEFSNFTTSYKNDVYFDYNDKEILRQKDDHSSNDQSFDLESRKHKSIYLSIPLMLKFQTSYLGYFRYFGRFGIRNDFLLMTRVDNQGKGFDLLGSFNDVTSLDAMRSKGYMNFYKGSVGISGGAEYNITGSTTLVAEIGYYYGFSEVFRQSEKQRSLYELEGVEGSELEFTKKYYSAKLKQSLLMLRVSVLF